MSEKKRQPLSDDAIERIVVREVAAAKRFVEEHKSSDRTERWDRYYGRALGNEQSGRSRYMSREVMDTIEWILPYTIRTFLAGEPKIDLAIDGQPAWAGRALLQRIHDDLLGANERSFFVTMYSWFKDAFVSDTAFVKPFWELEWETREVTFDMLRNDQMVRLLQHSDYTVRSAEEVGDDYGPDGPSYQNVKASTRVVRYDRVACDGVPHWEFICVPSCRNVNDEHGKGHFTEVTRDYLRRINRSMSDGDREFFPGLAKLEQKDGDGLAPSVSDSSEESSYRGAAETVDTADTGDGQDGRQRHQLTEWYDRIDVDGDGYLEDVVCWVADEVLLRWEKNDSGIVPICALSPILDCYKFFGISYADLVIEIQNLKTMLMRRLLDNFNFANSGRWIVDPNAAVDVARLMENVPGDVIKGKPDGVKDLAPRPFGAAVTQLVDYVDRVGEVRTGMTRYTQGTDAPSLNATATGIGLIQTAAQQRLELINRIFAETGVKDLYLKLGRLVQQNARQPFVVRLDGRDVTVDPQQIQGRLIARPNLGVEAALGQTEAMKIERLLGFLLSLNQHFPGIITPKEVHALAARYVMALGWKETSQFVTELERFVQEVQQRGQAQMQAQQAAQQAAVAEKQSDLALAREKLMVKERDSQRRYNVEILKLQQTAAPAALPA